MINKHLHSNCQTTAMPITAYQLPNNCLIYLPEIDAIVTQKSNVQPTDLTHKPPSSLIQPNWFENCSRKKFCKIGKFVIPVLNPDSWLIRRSLSKIAWKIRSPLISELMKKIYEYLLRHLQLNKSQLLYTKSRSSK